MEISDVVISQSHFFDMCSGEKRKSRDESFAYIEQLYCDTYYNVIDLMRIGILFTKLRTSMHIKVPVAPQDWG